MVVVRLLRLLALAALLLALAPATAFGLENRLARTPPMGWNHWNHFGCSVDERLVLETANALVASGMRNAGYRYVNVDDCWMARERAADGSLVADPVKFPHGMKWLAMQVHRRSLRFGMYISAGVETCAHYPGSFGHLGQDIGTLARWGVDYLKVDWCWPAPGSKAHFTFGRIRDLINATHRRMVFSVSDGWDPAWTWGAGTANLWRTGPDVDASWGAIARAVDQAAPLARYAGPGGWNDLDMLQIGNGRLSPTEGRAQISLWSVLAAPLIAGNDLRSMSPTTRALLNNREVISIDQDPAGHPGARMRAQHGHEVWIRQLVGGARAVLVLNRTRRAAVMRVNLRSLPGARGGRRYRVRDVWGHRSRTAAAWIATRVPAHGVAMFRVRRR
jgi:alpha-galactosidase